MNTQVEISDPRPSTRSHVNYYGPNFHTVVELARLRVLSSAKTAKQTMKKFLTAIKRHFCAHEWHVTGVGKFALAAEITRSDKIVCLKLMSCVKCGTEKLQFSSEGKLMATRKTSTGVEFRIV